MNLGRGRAFRVQGRGLWFALALLVLLTACQPLYLPPVPASNTPNVLTSLDDVSKLDMRGGVLTLHLVLATVADEGWLAVQWFAPSGAEATSDSVWIAPADAGQGRTLSLPGDVLLRNGEWRAVASYAGVVLRQFRFVVTDVP